MRRFLLPFVLISLLVIVPLFFRVLRPIVPLVIFAAWVRPRALLFSLRHSPLFAVCAAIPLVLVGFFVLQVFAGAVESYPLAVRQIAYYFLFPCLCIISALLVLKFHQILFSLPMIGLVALEYAALSWLYDAVIPGDLDLRANFEGGAAFFFVAFVFLTHKNPLFLSLFLAAYGAFAVYTEAAQGIIAVLGGFVLLAVRGVARKAVLLGFGMMPLFFPLLLPAILPYVQDLDSNVAFRHELWGSLYGYLKTSWHGLGFGQPLYQTVLSTAGFPYFDFPHLENVGMHNAILQLVAVTGIFGLLIGAALMGVATRVALRESDDLRIAIVFCLFCVSLSFNQAISHLAVATGTALFAGVLICAELLRASERLQRQHQTFAGAPAYGLGH